MPGATKYDVMEIELGMLKKIVDKKGKLSRTDIHDFQEKINHIKFNKKQVNSILATLIE